MTESEVQNKNKSPGNPFDLDGQQFDPDLYMQKVLKECTLQQVMDHSTEIVGDTQTLHSDMQTLVYENYNKFICAADTVRKMKNDFKKMEDEMDLLAKNMDSITSFSDMISSTLQDSRQQISKLSGIHSLLTRLQFLFKLPNKMKTQMQEGSYSQAVQDYLHTQRVLEQYGNLESFQGIQQECTVILQELKEKLHGQFKSKTASAKVLAESLDLLLQLDEPADLLCTEFLGHAEDRLKAQLEDLKDQPGQDIIEFVDLGSNGFLNDLCLIVTSFNDMFINRETYSDDRAVIKLKEFVMNNMKLYFDLVQSQVESQQEGGDSGILVRALDRFHRRLAAVNTLFTCADFTATGSEIVIRAGRRQCRSHLHALKAHFSECLTRVRQSLAVPRLITSPTTDTPSSSLTTELLTQLVLATVEKIKGVLQDLMVFLQPDLAFASNPKFLEAFCVDSVREGLVVGFIHHLTATARSFTTNSANPPALPLLLILSKMCLEYEATNVHYLLSFTDEWFSTEAQSGGALLTTESEMCSIMRLAAQELLNHYVRMQGLAISQMLRKSVETRDWLHSLEPRTVRAVMKRVMEEIAAADTQVGMLFEEGTRAERSSDSSRKTQSRVHRSTASNWSSHSLAANHIQKLFSERIEIFAPVQFSKVSILTGIIKISLKTLLECVRLRTFSRYGLQQIQVDTHYLKLYLWQYVADENLVHFLLDEILDSAVHRCLDPVLMEPSVVDVICERG